MQRRHARHAGARIYTTRPVTKLARQNLRRTTTGPKIEAPPCPRRDTATDSRFRSPPTPPPPPHRRRHSSPVLPEPLAPPKSPPSLRPGLVLTTEYHCLRRSRSLPHHPTGSLRSATCWPGSCARSPATPSAERPSPWRAVIFFAKISADGVGYVDIDTT